MDWPDTAVLVDNFESIPSRTWVDAHRGIKGFQINKGLRHGGRFYGKIAPRQQTLERTRDYAAKITSQFRVGGEDVIGSKCDALYRDPVAVRQCCEWFTRRPQSEPADQSNSSKGEDDENPRKNTTAHDSK